MYCVKINLYTHWACKHKITMQTCTFSPVPVQGCERSQSALDPSGHWWTSSPHCWPPHSCSTSDRPALSAKTETNSASLMSLPLLLNILQVLYSCRYCSHFAPFLCDLRQTELTRKKFVLLKNMKLILDRDNLSASLRETLDSREAGRVIWAKGLNLSDSKSICERRGEEVQFKQVQTLCDTWISL